MKPALFLGLVTAITLGLALAPAGARSAFLTQLVQQYRLEHGADVPEVGCQYCHVKSYGGRNWNAFGERVRAEYLGAARRDIAQALYRALVAKIDTDRDGFADALEVVARTYPGDPTSKPTQPKASLEAQLDQLGGVDAFRVKP